MGDLARVSSARVTPVCDNIINIGDVEEGRSLQIVSVTDEPAAAAGAGAGAGENNKEAMPMDSWLPITQSRKGNAFTATFHLICSGIGAQALILPTAFISLGMFWGILCLSLIFLWQFYTIGLLVNLHESQSGIRFSRYVHLSLVSFGVKLGKLLAIFPTMYLSGGTCVLYIINGATVMEYFHQLLCGDNKKCLANSPTGLEWYLVFVFMAIFIAQFFPSLNSLYRTSLIGSITAITYCTLIWILSAANDRPEGVSHDPLERKPSDVARFRDIINGIGLIALAFRGHNVMLEIQGTLPSNWKSSSREPMWKGVLISYILIALCLFPLGIVGYWAYGNKMTVNVSILVTLSKYHKNNISKEVFGLIYLLVVINYLCAYQIYAMPVFDNLERIYITKKKQACPKHFRFCIKLFFGGLTYFIAITFPFLGSIGPFIGGIGLPVTLAYPCFMWISIKKPSWNSAPWLFNLALGFLGIFLSIVLAVVALWTLIVHGLDANFYRPK